MRNLHWLQHVPFEGLGCIEGWAKDKGMSISKTRCYEYWDNPNPEAIDLLVVMGGPMNIYEDYIYPWLTTEKKFIENTISAGASVLGICLGAQLIADVMGSKITQNKHKEIGWFPVKLTKQGKDSKILQTFPTEFTAFHWHGDTFEMPHEATHLAKSKACANQAFEYDNRVVGLQFHLEMMHNGIFQLICNCFDEIEEDKYIQNQEIMIDCSEKIKKSNALMNSLLDQLIA